MRILPIRHRGERGEALILVLIFLVLFSLVMAALLSGVGTNFSMTAVTRDQSQLMYAADAGLEWGSAVQRTTNSSCGTSGSFTPVAGSDGSGNAPFTVPAASGGNVTVHVQCLPISGLGSNSFGGYAAITGINYPASASGSQEFAGNTGKCQTISADPIGSGSPTYAKNVTGTTNAPPLCLTYPAGTVTTPSWTDDNFDPVDVRTGAIDATVTSGLTTIASASLFSGTADFTGWTVADSAGFLPSGATIVAENDTLHSATLSTTATGTALGSDQLTLTGSNTGAGDATVKSGNNTVTSASLFTGSANYVGWPITDSANAIPGNTTIKTEDNSTHKVTLSVNATANASADTLTVGGVLGYSPLQSIRALDEGNYWAVGGALTNPPTDQGNEGIFWFDGEDAWNYVGGTTDITGQILNGVWPGTTHDVWAVGNGGTILYCGTAGEDCTGNGTMPSWVAQSDLKSATDGSLVNGKNTASSPTLFTGSADYTGWGISDSAGKIQGGTTITAENNVTHTATMSKNATATVSSDTFTLTPPGGPNLLAITGADTSHLWAVGQGGLILTCTSACTSSSAVWSAATSPTTKDLQSVYTDGAGDVWAVGSNVILSCSTNCDTAQAVWVQVTAPPGGLNTLESVSGLDASHLWAVDVNNKIITCTGACKTAAATWVTPTTPPTGVKTLQSVVAADSTNVWAVGTNSANAGEVLHCTTSCNTSGAVWTSEIIDQAESTMYSVTAVPAALRTGPTWAGDVWAVGTDPKATNQSGWIGYSPLTGSAASLADITGGPVLNGQNTNFATGMTIHQGNFDQWFKSPSTCPSKPTNLTVLPGTIAAKYNCLTPAPNPPIPPLVQNLDEPLPSESGMAACVKAGNCVDMGAHPFTQSVSGVPGCASFTVYAPGYYKTAPKFASGATAYFESGVYYFNTGGWGAIGADGKPPVYMIGGQPSKGDLESEVNNVPPATTSPCWPAVKGYGDTWRPTGNWYDGGTGVEWILGGGTWQDLHTVTMELFSRQMPVSQITNECGPGATQPCSQGVTVHEVPPLCPTGTTTTAADGAVHPGPYCVTSASKWAPSAAGGEDQLIQIDANKHNPYVYLHGGIYMPDSNMTLFTNQHGVWTGPIDVNSLELTYMSAGSPALQIIAGGPTLVQFELVATATDPTGSSLTEEAVATVDYTKTPTKLTIQSWRVCNGTSSGPGSCST